MSTSEKQAKNIFNVLFGALNTQMSGMRKTILRIG